MLNIGKLGSDALDYYLGAVAKDEAEYYFGAGEAPGRWLGSLAPELGLSSPVEREHLERVLAGLHPLTGEELLSAAGSNARARQRRQSRARPAEPETPDGVVDVGQVAARLRVTTRAVRHFLAAGEAAKALIEQASDDGLPLEGAPAYRARLDELTAAGEVPEGLPATFLLGDRRPRRGRTGYRHTWAIPADEVDRLAEARRVPGARSGWDLVFRPPKSYSVLWAVGDADLREAIRAIHHEAVETALSYLEDGAAVARTTVARRRVRVGAAGFVVAAFDHRDSRAGDPLLHTHCVTVNLTRLPDGRFGALDARALYLHGLAGDAVYQATFRHLAERRLGLKSEPVVNGWADVEGVPRAVVERFSRRSEEIAAELERVGTASAAARQVAAVATRQAKAARRDGKGLHQRWREEAAAMGFDEVAVARCLGRARPAEVNGARLEALFDRLAGPEGLTETAATFTRAEVVAALGGVLGSGVHGRDLPDLADRFLSSPRVVQVREHRPGLPRARLYDPERDAFADDLAAAAFTTPDLARIEAELMTGADAEGGPRLAPGFIDGALSERPHLSTEQTAVVTSVLASTRRLRPVVGHAGSGKTSAAEAMVAALRGAGVPVIGCAVTAEAADELARASGLGTACDTLARTLLDIADPEGGGLAPRTVVIIDEASTVSHRQLARLLARVEAAGGALVLLGDPHQHGAVGPGHFFGWLVGRDGAEVPRLRSNQRQRDVLDPTGAVVVSLAAEREAIDAYREGRVAEALFARDAAGLVARAASAPELYEAVVADWDADRAAGGTDPMIASTNWVRARLNAAARQRLSEAGALRGPVLEVASRAFQAGDWVVARRNDRRLRSPTDPTWVVRNGARGVVTKVHRRAGAVVVDFAGHHGADHRVRIPARYLEAGRLEHGYAVTDYLIQGRTLERARAVVDDATTRAGAYVATTRGRLENRLYLVDGTVAEAADPAVSHGAPPVRPTGFDALIERLEAEGPEALLHEIDPAVEPAGTLARRHSLRSLHRALAPLGPTLAGAPPDPARALAELARREEALLAQRRVAGDQLAGGSPEASDRGNLAEELAARVRSLEGRLTEVRDRAEALSRQGEAREAYLEDHAEELARARLLREAIARREATVRIAAPSLLSPLLASARAQPPEELPRALRARWRAALAAAALFGDRFGTERTENEAPSLAESLLGARPDDPFAALAWDDAASSLADAEAAIERVTAREARYEAERAAGRDQPLPLP